MLSGLANANGSPQQAAAAAVGVAFAVIPYCFTRALSEINREVRADKTQQSPGVRPEREEVELSAPVQSTPALQETSWDDPSGRSTQMQTLKEKLNRFRAENTGGAKLLNPPPSDRSQKPSADKDFDGRA